MPRKYTRRWPMITWSEGNGRKPVQCCAALPPTALSLLPAGIVKVSGDFRFGDPVVCIDMAAHHFAQGLVNYSAAELQAISGQQTSHIETLLGYKGADEVIHRDNLVVFAGTD